MAITAKCWNNKEGFIGGRHSTEEAFALPTQPSRVRFLAPLSEWTANIKTMRSNPKKVSLSKTCFRSTNLWHLIQSEDLRGWPRHQRGSGLPSGLQPTGRRLQVVVQHCRKIHRDPPVKNHQGQRICSTAELHVSAQFQVLILRPLRYGMMDRALAFQASSPGPNPSRPASKQTYRRQFFVSGSFLPLDSREVKSISKTIWICWVQTRPACLKSKRSSHYAGFKPSMSKLFYFI